MNFEVHKGSDLLRGGEDSGKSRTEVFRKIGFIKEVEMFVDVLCCRTGFPEWFRC